MSSLAGQVQQKTYGVFYPERKSIFVGCLPSSSLPAFAQGGFSAAAGRQAKTPTKGVPNAGALSLEAAASTVLTFMKAFVNNQPLPGMLPLSDSDDNSDVCDGPLGPSGGPGTSGETAASRWAAKLAIYKSLPLIKPPPSSAPRYFRIATTHGEVQAIIRRALALDPSWSEVPSEYGNAPVWDLMWSWGRPPVDRARMLAWQRINHFRHAKELTRKDLLKKNLSRYQCLGEKMSSAFALQTLTFVLPKEYLQFAEAFGRNAQSSVANQHQLLTRRHVVDMQTNTAQQTPESNLWIMKPAGLSRGRGISVISDINQLNYAEGCIIQKYVHNPLLLDGYKWDLRLYVLVTSFSPLEAFLYTKGFARLSSRPFTADPAQVSDLFVHLTNSSVQKYSETSKGVMDALAGATDAQVGGTKCSLDYLWKRLQGQGIDTNAVWNSIVDLVVKSLICVDDVIPNQPNSFEVFGYDVLVDANLRPWLIEVNGSPSLSVDSAMDLAIKTQMIADTIALVKPLPMDRERLVSMLEKYQSVSAAPPAAQWESDLAGVLRGEAPRAIGEEPLSMGAYQRICPGTDAFNRAMKLKFTHFRKKS
jgi:tubulin polyglutamylase TTLL5